MPRVLLFGMFGLLLLNGLLQAEDSKPISLYNGKDLSGWRGQGMHDPKQWNDMKPEEREKKQTQYNGRHAEALESRRRRNHQRWKRCLSHHGQGLWAISFSNSNGR